MIPLDHPILSQQAQDALANGGYVQSDRFDDDEWKYAEDEARAGRPAYFEWMLIQDAAHARADSMAMHDPAYREGHVSLDLLFDIDAIARDEGSYLPGSCVS